MGMQSISFKVGPHKSGHGFPLPMGSDIPKMKGRKDLKLSVEIEKLDSVLDSLATDPCSFWACKGPSYPVNMVICSKCSAMRDIASVRATLARQLGEGNR